MNSLMFLLFFVVFIPLFLIAIFMPYWTRRTESFGVTIPEEIYESPPLQKMRKQYALFTGIESVIATVILFLLGSIYATNDEAMGIAIGILVALFLIGSFFIYLKFHQEMKKLKQKENWAEERSQQIFVDTKFREKKLTYSNWWFFLPMIVAIGLIFITFQSYQQIPDQIPMQYNLQGEVTNAADKSYLSVLFAPAMIIYMALLFLFINVTIAKSKQQMDPSNPKSSIQRNIIFRRRWSAFLIITNFAMTLLFMMMQLSLIYPISQGGVFVSTMVMVAVIIIGAVILSITTGQGGSRIKENRAGNENVMNQDDDEHWKLGQFYFNKDDPALFLEKRFGIGWTINFARPSVWMILVLIIGSAFLLPYLLTL